MKEEENKEENTIINYIKKQHLIHNKWYEGDCRNSSYAIWNANKEKFEYVRYKFGTSYIERLNCIEDSADWEDVFIPYNVVFVNRHHLALSFVEVNSLDDVVQCILKYA